jgi:archaetidylinositol phosphate synthase
LLKAILVLTRLKQKVQGILVVEAKIAHNVGLTPNGISIIGVIFAFLSAAVFATWQYSKLFLLLAPVLLLFSGFCDALDGVVARTYEQSTVFGGFLDSLLDRYADAAVYIGIIVGGLWEPVYWGFYWGMLALIGSLLVSYSRARAEASGIRMESIGLAERAERMLILVVASLVALFFQPTIVMTVALIVLSVLTNLTVLQRSIYVYSGSKKKVAGPS